MKTIFPDTTLQLMASIFHRGKFASDELRYWALGVLDATLIMPKRDYAMLHKYLVAKYNQRQKEINESNQSA